MITKTRKQLERELKGDKELFLLILMLVIILAICFGIYSSGKDKLKEQLSECQEQVPVWTLKVECESDDGIFIVDFTTKEKFQYDFWIKYFKSENCEVIGLENQLSGYQGQIPVWTLKVECIDHELANYIYFEDNYTDYELYQEVIKRFDDLKEFENCEVIE